MPKDTIHCIVWWGSPRHIASRNTYVVVRHAENVAALASGGRCGHLVCAHTVT